MFVRVLALQLETDNISSVKEYVEKKNINFNGVISKFNSILDNSDTKYMEVCTAWTEKV